jgi:hypothetical protein
MQVVARVSESRLLSHLIRFVIGVTSESVLALSTSLNFMSVLAPYIPWFIKDLGVSIIGEVSALDIFAIPSGVDK